MTATNRRSSRSPRARPRYVFFPPPPQNLARKQLPSASDQICFALPRASFCPSNRTTCPSLAVQFFPASFVAWFSRSISISLILFRRSSPFPCSRCQGFPSSQTAESRPKKQIIAQVLGQRCASNKQQEKKTSKRKENSLNVPNASLGSVVWPCPKAGRNYILSAPYNKRAAKERRKRQKTNIEQPRKSKSRQTYVASYRKSIMPNWTVKSRRQCRTC